MIGFFTKSRFRLIRNALFFCLGTLIYANSAAQSPAQAAQNHLQAKVKDLGLVPQDLMGMELTDQNYSAQTGVSNVYFRQKVTGIGIWQAVANVNVGNGNEILSYGCSFLTGVYGRTNTSQPAISAIQAIGYAASAYGLGTPNNLQLLNPHEGAEQIALYSKGDISQENIPVKLMYVEDAQQVLRLCWDLSILTKRGDHWWSLRVDALNGDIVSEYDWTLSCHWDKPGDGVMQHHFNMPAPSPMPLLAPPSINAPNTYNVYADPVESPNHGNRTIVASPWVLAASPFGWHDTNGANGAEFTITRGNNVWAMDDQNGNNGTGASPNGTATLTFDFPINFANQPGTYLDAATTNLFYWNNRVHDVWYGYGFDDASGNFQQNNYGRGGTGNDYVIADCQDGSGMDNANMSTPPDGSSPRMQMFLWTGQPTVTFLVNSPGLVAGSYDAVPAAFGPAPPATPLTANLVLVNDGSAAPTEGCNALVNAAAVNNKIALVDRGTCAFVNKVQNAQNAGAIACVVCNNVPGSATQMGGTSGTITIPSVMISQSDCALLKAQLASGVNVSLSGTAGNINRDGDLDNLIIAHEYTHGISNRLTGGRNNTSCLGNQEQMGEGWSDWYGLMMTIKPGDVGTKLRGVGTYAIFQPTTGGGIRPSPYTTDMNVNPWTYGDITNTTAISRPHGIGFLWCNMLWEMTWMLIDRYGFDPDLVNGTGGNNVAMRLVTDAMKLQPCSPGFVDGRDAILLADQNNFGGVNRCLIWTAFAKRGLGFSATQGSTNSRLDGSEAFDLPNDCSIFPVEWLNIAATPLQKEIKVDWSLSLEIGNKGFDIERKAEGEEGFTKIGAQASRGNTSAVSNYTFIDTKVQAGITYFYRVRQIDEDGHSSFSEVASARLEPSAFFGVQIAPNPSSGLLNISLSGDVTGTVNVEIFSIVGQSIYSNDFDQNAALRGLQLDLNHLPAGQYFINVKTAKHASTAKWLKQ